MSNRISFDDGCFVCGHSLSDFITLEDVPSVKKVIFARDVKSFMSSCQWCHTTHNYLVKTGVPILFDIDMPKWPTRRSRDETK